MGESAVDPRRRPTFRVLPRRANALLNSLLALLFLVVINSGVGTVSVNGRVATGAERAQALTEIRLIFDPIFLLMLVWHGRRLMRGSPYDNLEISPEGLLVRGLFGTKRLPWQAIHGFSFNYIPLTRPPMIWITARLDPALASGRDIHRIGMGGYVAFSFNPFRARTDDVAEIATWLNSVKAAYRADVPLPRVPDLLEDLIMEVGPRTPSAVERG